MIANVDEGNAVLVQKFKDNPMGIRYRKGVKSLHFAMQLVRLQNRIKTISSEKKLSLFNNRF